MIIGSATANIDDNLKKADDANDAAAVANNGVKDINSDNKLTPNEKLSLKRLYDSDVLKHDFDVKQLTSMSLPTADIDLALSNLTSFTAKYFVNMDITEEVDRQALNKVFNDFENADKAVEGLFNDAVQQVADDAKAAGEEAKEAGEKAQEVGEEAKASADQAKVDATQAKADAATAQQKAQSSINQLNEATTKFDGEITDAKNSAQQALDNITVVDSKVDKLSTSTTAQFNTLNNGYQEVISTVDNMDIGGRNIVLDSSNMGSFRIWQADGNSKLSDDKKEITITTSHGGINIEKKNLSEYLPNKGDTIVISADVKGNSHLQFNYNNGNNFVGSGTSIAVTTEYKRYFTTFEWNPVNLDKTDFIVYAAGSAEQYLTVKNVKVEIGNKGTDWSPAPEDFASQTQITTLNNLIDQKVSNDKYQSDKIQTANLIASKVSTVDFNNLKISNRNLALGTATSVTVAGTNANNQVIPGYKLSITIPNSTVVTATFDIASSTGVGTYIMQFNGNDTGGSWQTISAGSLVNGTKHVSVTFTTDSNHLNVHPRLDNATGTVTISNFIISESSKEVSWTPAPEDLATSTEFDQLSNAIKLKADSSDVTSQINVAVKGVQTDVTNKVSSLTTQINQTSDAVQILNTTSGLRNLVYNSSYANNAEGWNMFNGVGYLSTVPASSYNGSPGFGVNISGKGASTWTQFGESKHYALPSVEVREDNTYSASAMIKMYDDSDSTAKLAATIAYFDKNGARITGWKDMIVTYSQNLNWTEVKFENMPVPSGAQTVAIQFHAYGSKVHGMIAQPMIVFGPKIGTYNPDTVGQSDITASIDNINLGVKNADGSTSTFNMNGNTILMDTAQTIINGNTSIQNGTIGTAKIANAAINTAQIADGAINNAKIANASIDDAKINSLNGNKIIARSITSQQLNADDIIANVINGKTINGITINTPNLQLGTNGTLTEDWTLNQATSLFNPKKGSGTMTLTKGLLATEGTLSRWWSNDGGYWYGIGDDGSKIKNGSNQVGDNYGAGYAQHNIFDSKGNTLLRTYMDATGLYMNSGGTSNVNTVLTQQGLTTTNVTALGDINGASLTTSGWINAGIGSGNGIRIGFRTIQSHNTQDLYFNGDDNKQSVTLHAKSIVQSSQLSRKKDIKPLDPDYAMKVIRNSDMYGYRYNEDSPTEPLHYSGIIDDVNGTPQYKMPEEFISEDRTGRNDGNTVAFLVEALKQADKRIGILEGMMNHD